MTILRILLCCYILVSILSCKEKGEASVDDQVLSEYQEWKTTRIDNLKKNDGWLTLIGLHWLDRGVNTVGSSEENKIVLPANVPVSVGEIVWGDDSVYFNRENESVFVAGGNADKSKLTDDLEGNPTMMNYQSVYWYLIKRGEKYGIRVKDTNAIARIEFDGMDTYEYDKKWRLNAKYIIPSQTDSASILNAIGISEKMPVAAYLEFDIAGSSHRLMATNGGENEVFIVFGDQTMGLETYGGGRFMYVERARNGESVTIDFNKAYNPPCVFTDYATCPLPTKANILPFRVEAGEKEFGHH